MKTNGHTLSNFIAEQKERLARFEEYWTVQNKLDPEMFPLQFEADNAGAWGEQFMAFDGVVKESDVAKYTPKFALGGKIMYTELSESVMTLVEAEDYAKNCREGGFDDWMLPEAYQTRAFSSDGVISKEPCWTITQCDGLENCFLSWHNAGVFRENKSYHCYVICVRLVSDKVGDE